MTKPKTRGRPRNPELTAIRKAHPDWSERTVARYAEAYRLIEALHLSQAAERSLMAQYTWRDGSIRVAPLLAALDAEARLRLSEVGDVG